MVNNFLFNSNKKYKDSSVKSQRQLRVGEELRHLISNALLRESFYDGYIKNNNITITEVNVSPDLKNARAYVIPLGGKNAESVVNTLTEFSYLVRKALSKKIDMKFLPKVYFVNDRSFDYAEKIEKLIKKNK